MNTKQQYSYTVLRYIPDVVTGEFINVGVIVHFPHLNKIWEKCRISSGRLRGIYPDADRGAYRAAIVAVQKGLKRINRDLATCGLVSSMRDAGEIARMAMPADDSSVQWGPTGGGFAADPEATLLRLFNRYVALYDVRRPTRKTDEDVWRPVRDRLAERMIAIEFVEKTVASKVDEIDLKHAWKNGAWHAYEPVSLDLSDVEEIKDKARRLRGQMDGVAQGADEELKLSLVIGRPQNEALKSACEQAVKILETSAMKPNIYFDTEAHRLVSDIETEVRAHEKEAD